jgi:formiminoglutamase
VTEPPRTEDPLWPRASDWLAKTAGDPSGCRMAVLGVPAHRSSITPTGAHATPAAVRAALGRYSTFAASRGVDVAELPVVDLGDVEEPDGSEGEQRVRDAAATAGRDLDLLLAIGGDNSVTFPLMSGLFGGELAACGLITVDAHHDLRDGESNGSPVRRLLEAGLQGRHVVQVGIADFSNSAAYAARAAEHRITVIGRDELRRGSVADIVADALETAGGGGRPVYVDIDVDVCDRAEVPGCPSSAPGGLSADELRQMAFLLAQDPRVRGMDITEIDATTDAADGRTVRLAALLVLEAAAGLVYRLERIGA